ncbi:hypothetical protein RN001_001104 [Aquatica leii]|uniref:NADH dehydrogenase [ubiquinone] 1 alpha subcomplex subunit 8 n=1 Tax=Aquatica leii TaxID=1421715 RepID=A0AAN7SQS6_9COLE|nr:hypothetical protein RN001_001104 [Aquatica leii]
MGITEETELPLDEDLEVKEVNISGPALKAAAFHYGKDCEFQNNEFVLCRNELDDPRRCIDEGKAVTKCALAFFRKIKKSCFEEFEQYVHCLDKSSTNQNFSVCRKTQSVFDKCMQDNFNMERPYYGYFSEVKVHQTSRPKPAPEPPAVYSDTPDSLPEDVDKPPAKYGLSPHNPQEVISRLPDHKTNENVDPNALVSEVVVDMLKVMRYSDDTEPKRKRRVKVDVQPGMSISVEDLNSSQNDKNTDKSSINKTKSSKKQVAEPIFSDEDSSLESNDIVYMESDDDGDFEDFRQQLIEDQMYDRLYDQEDNVTEFDEINPELSNTANQTEPEKQCEEGLSLTTNDFVLVRFETLKKKETQRIILDKSLP